MTVYEFTFITKGEDKDLLKNIEKIISDMGGKITQKESLGKKGFAYKIQNFTSGVYHIWTIELDGTSLKQAKNKLNLEPEVLRYLILRKD